MMCEKMQQICARQRHRLHHRHRCRQVTSAPVDLNLTFAVAGWLLAMTILFNLVLPPFIMAAAMLATGEQSQTAAPIPYGNIYDYHCFQEATSKDYVSSTLNVRQPHVGLLVSDHITHQLITRIFAILLREKLHHHNVTLIPYKYDANVSAEKFELYKFQHTLNMLSSHPQWKDSLLINLGVWMPPVGHGLIPKYVYEAGPSLTAGRYGWFVPEFHYGVGVANNSLDELHYSIFLDAMHPEYNRFVINEKLLNYLRQNTDWEAFISPACMNRACVTLLAEHKYDTAFVEHQIKEVNASVNILWLGAGLREKVAWLYKLYRENETYRDNSFIVLHWTPSILIDGDIIFRQIVMPQCEESLVLQKLLCKYEFTPILKYYKSPSSEKYKRLLEPLRSFLISDAARAELQQDLSRQLSLSNNVVAAVEDVYNAIACRWLENNVATYSKWIVQGPKMQIPIGGIFPIWDTSRGHQNLVAAVERAVEAINRNKTVLANYDLVLQKNDGQCKPDIAMKAFIHYFNTLYMLGVLGPACSETVEPIAGISKHTNMAVISYSAEGASFVDRDTYPYFFRTIGSNRQYEDVYINLMKHFGWRRVAALTEDGQKYTEYISHMEAAMKLQNLELVWNKKFLREVTPSEMNKHLLDLRQRHAKIIIADVHARSAELVLCEAYKLDMTAQHGYVWFLPSWLSKNWTALNTNSNNSCTSKQLQIAFNGHLSIRHTPFGAPNAIMQENISVHSWLERFKPKTGSISDYTGFAYDATWAFALAADKLLGANPDAVSELRSQVVIKRFTELLWDTDFDGLSGRVRFGEGGSRITQLDILQWQHSQFVEVGHFYPAVMGAGKDLRPRDGTLVLPEGAIKWITDGAQPPGDGTYDCSFAGLAEFLGTDCDSAAVIFSAIMCALAVVVVSLVSFLFWKKRYDSKLMKSAKIMKNFGIDLLSSSNSSNSNPLEKWEVPKENVVMNRRLGEGAFGTVYGGEAQLNTGLWTAVAVKTLKVGACDDDRFDFLSEAVALKGFDHENIVKLLGVCLQSEPIYTIMEFMLYGDLKTYLLARRHLVDEGDDDNTDFSPWRLTMYAMDVARGLAYLVQKKYVHRDIACRNCLVNAQRVVKIGDFGMARSTFQRDYYRFNRKAMLPVRWMAPESLAQGIFSPASDVWSFGVVLYEIITFGSFPYQGLTNNQVWKHVTNGNTLEIPSGVKPHLEGLIKACWSKDRKKRPTATEIVGYISKHPRLLTPCLDFPGASVEMPETESDQQELLPKLCKSSPINCDSTLDILPHTINMDTSNDENGFVENLEMPVHTNIAAPTENTQNTLPANLDSFSLITPDGYSIMSPLLMRQISESSDSSHARPPLEILQQTPF